MSMAKVEENEKLTTRTDIEDEEKEEVLRQVGEGQWRDGSRGQSDMQEQEPLADAHHSFMHRKYFRTQRESDDLYIRFSEHNSICR